MSQYGKLTAGLLGAWFTFSLSASALHLFRTAPGSPPLPVGLAVLVPVLIFLTWFGVSPGFRKFVMSLNARTLTFVQSWRVGGFVFLVLAAYGILPAMFALPSGWGDIAIGATASLVALKLARPEHKTGFISWQLLGMADLAMAVSLGTLSGFINPHGTDARAMSVLPLSLIPTFAVPLLLILHFICIAQARKWPVRQYAPLREVHSSAI